MRARPDLWVGAYLLYGEGRPLAVPGLLRGGARRPAVGPSWRFPQLVPEPGQRSVERDLDRVRPHAEDLADLTRGQVGPVPQREQVAGVLVERPDRGGEHDPALHVGS